MSILVTGWAGFIGSHLVDRLIADGHTVVGIDNFDDFYDPGIKRRNVAQVLSMGELSVVEGDIRDVHALERCFASGKVDTVIHLAARAGVRPSLRQPELYFDVNVMGTLRLLEMMQKHGVSRMLFASSSSVYGNNPKIPFSETDKVDNPVSPYAASKRAGELLCYTFHHLYQFDVYCLRLFTVYGPRQRPEMAIHQFNRKIMTGEPVVIYGDGTSRRDYTYIEDVVDGFIKSLAVLSGYEILNLGESHTVTLNALVALLEQFAGKKAVIRREPVQPGDVEVTYANIEKARRLIGYDPRWSLERGLGEFVEWFKTLQHNR